MNKKIFAILAVCAMVMTACGPVVEESAQLPETSEKTTTANVEAETTVEVETTTAADSEKTATADSAVENAAGGNNNSAETAAVQTTEKADPNKMAELDSASINYVPTYTKEDTVFPELSYELQAIPEINTDLSQFDIPDFVDAEYKVIEARYYGAELSSYRLCLANSHNDEVFSAVYYLDEEYWSAPYYKDYEYDAKGNMTLKQEYDQDKVSDTYTWEYDGNGRITRQTQSKPGTDVLYYSNNTYDQYGNLLAAEGINLLNGEVKDTYTYEYDANGNAVYGKGDVTDPWLFNEFRQKFDDRGNVVEYVGKCRKTYETHRECAYDNNNNCIYEKYFTLNNPGEKETISSVRERLYDDNNNCIYEKWYTLENGEMKNSGENYTHYTQYDEKGRILKEHEHQAGETDSTIIYFYEELS